VVEHISQTSKGAPLRALIIVAVCWVFGRAFWEILTPNPPQFSARAERELVSSPEPPMPQTRQIPWPPINKPYFYSGVQNLKYVSKIATKTLHPFLQRSNKPVTATKTSAISDLPSLDYYNNGISAAAATHWSASQKDTRTGSKPLKKPSLSRTPTNTGQKNPLSAYFWIFARQSSGGPGSQAVASTQIPSSQYGGSQAGAILSYRVLGDRQRNFSVYGRLTTALSVSGEDRLAMGIKIKPSSKIPVSIYAERRFDGSRRTGSSTAVFAAGGIGPVRLKDNLNLEAYGQTGYVLGSDSTYFFDASTVIQKTIINDRRNALALGAGLWAGGQKDAMRVDIGPRASIRIPVNHLSTRVSVDWRIRIAGNATPGSGLAVTLSTGF